MSSSTRDDLWQGRRVRLRAIETTDWEAFHADDQDPVAARYGYQTFFPRSSDAARRWAADMAARVPESDNVVLAIENEAGDLVGSVSTQKCDRRNGTFSYGIGIFREHWRNGYASEAIRLLLRHYFLELRYQKVTVTVYSFNEPSIKLHERLGFHLEGRLRRMGFTNGAYFDHLQFGMTVEEFATLHANSF